MKASVIAEFRDKNHFNIVYSKGEVVDFDAERVSALEKAGVLKRITAEVVDFDAERVSALEKAGELKRITAEVETEKGEKGKK